MRIKFLNACLVAMLTLAGTVAIARNPVNSQPPKHSNYKEETGGCNIPADQFDMDVNNVRARLLDAGDNWWDFSNGKYEVPKGDKTSSTPLPQAIFAGAIWVSALDQGSNLKMAALEYRQGTSDYFTGPLDNTGNVNLAQCNLWDAHFPVWSTQITPIVNAYASIASTGGQIPDNLIADSVKFWPGKGNPYLAAIGYDVSGILAPFYDANGDGIYDPKYGDYPTIKQGGTRAPGVGCDSLVYACNGNGSYADEMVFCVYNDKGNIHTASNGSPMGIQVNELAFAFQTSDDLNNMTFYTYNIINKSGNVLNKTYMSQWVDPDLGCANNDRVGCDTSRSLAVVYNGYVLGGPQAPGTSITCDEGSVCPTSEVGYGCELPMLGVEYFEGPTDTTTTLNPVTHVRTPNKLGMTAFCYFTNNAPTAYADPSTASQFRDYMTGYWLDGSHFTYGGPGHGATTIPTNYMFPGDPSVATEWSECNSQQAGVSIAAADRRMVQTSGPFTFLPCASEIITVGVIFVQPTGGVGSNCPSFSFIDGAADKAKALFNACFQELAGPSAPILDLRALDGKVIINIVDDPTGNNVGETYAQPDQLRVNKGFVSGEDSLYRFQGYVVYQLSGPTITASDLSDPTKAAPIAVYDIADNISHLVNYTQYSDPVTGAAGWQPSTQTIPGVGNNLPNIGIQHSLVDSLDAIGGGIISNHQTYYFGVISFATNNFKNFNPTTGVGQYQPFLLGKNFNKYSVIPENSSATDGGRLLKSTWGTSTQVKRLEGQGNGGNYIDLDAPTIASIINLNSIGSPVQYLDTLNYVVGEDPLAFIVTDPILLKEADFVLTVRDTMPYNGVSVSSSAWWELYDSTNNVTIHSSSTLDKPFQQIIADALGNEYGFALTLGTPFPVYINYTDSLPVYGPIGGTISYSDPSSPWLSFLKDSGQTIANNWIRSGSYELPCAQTNPDPICNVFVDAYYRTCSSCNPILTDPNGLFGGIAGSTWAPYCLAANFSMGPNQPVVSGRPLSVGGPGFKWDRYDDKAASPENNLDQMQSVDIVITSDKSKWSQCVVFETGDIPVLDLPTAPDGSTVPPRKGMLRNHYALNKTDGTYINDPTQVGLSWFPGYAINVESGERLNIAFGEASDEGNQNGRDMIWNPTSTLFTNLNQGGDIPYTPLFGGKHFIYVMNSSYDGGGQLQQDFVFNYYTTMVTNPTSQPYPQPIRDYYKTIIWTCIPYLTPGYTMNSVANGLVPSDVTIKLRVQKPYNKFATNATNPADTSVFARYTFSTKGLGPVIHDDSVARTALDIIRIVPNPYLAYSAYEVSANDAEIKVTNLPNNCTIKIFTLDGVLVRTLNRSLNVDPVTNKQIEITDGYDLSGTTINSSLGSSALDNSVSWDLKNQAAIPVASGIYLFDINVPGVGHKVLKWFGAVRPTDVSNF